MLTGAILSGGMSTRMGQEKGLTMLHGEPFIMHVHRAMVDVVDEVIVSVAKGMARTYAAALGNEFTIIEDKTPSLGPLGGIISVLERARSTYVLFSPCDTPFLKPSVCELIVSWAQGGDGAVPKTGKTFYEPLHGAYKRLPGLAAFQEAVACGSCRPRYAFKKLELRFVPEETIREIDPGLESFWSVNTRADLKLAEGRFRNED